MDIIQSGSNAKVKLVRSLGQKKYRDVHMLYIAEGFNILKDVDASLICQCIVKEEKLDKYIGYLQDNSIPFFVASNTVFDSMSTTQSTQGIIGIMRQKQPKSVAGDTVLVLDSVRDPGNMGTMLRSAAAFGVDTVIAIDCCDLYNPKVVRSTMGAVFVLNVIELDGYDTLDDIIDGYRLCYLDMGGQNVYDFATSSGSEKLAIAVGNEVNGVSKQIRQRTKTALAIPMKGGKMESLNAAVSASIALSVLCR